MDFFPVPVWYSVVTKVNSGKLKYVTRTILAFSFGFGGRHVPTTEQII